MCTFTMYYICMYILGESESTRGLPLPTKHGHGLLSSQLIRQPTAPTSAHTTTETVFYFYFFNSLSKSKLLNTLSPQTPTPTRSTAQAHSTHIKSTDPVYGSVSLSDTGDRCGAERWIALARQRASSIEPSMREFSRQMTAATWRS